MNSHYERYLKSEKMSDNTIRAYLGHIGQALDYIGKADEDITYLDLIDWKASISDLSSSTVALRSQASIAISSSSRMPRLLPKTPAKALSGLKLRIKLSPI